MIDVFHHLSCAALFLNEVTRCLKPGGTVVMIEPWHTPWAKMIFKYLHHEPFDPESKQWTFPKGGPLSQANQALPWMVFSRDRNRFELEFPKLKIKGIEPDMPFAYLLSGGVSLKSFVPGRCFKTCRKLEQMLKPWMKSVAMFAKITLIRTNII
jgi:hypothetical protein